MCPETISYKLRVKLGVDVRTGETVAIKIMYKDNMTARAAQQLRREITSMKALDHPNVLRLKDVHEVGFSMYDNTMWDSAAQHYAYTLYVVEGKGVFIVRVWCCR